MSNRDSNFEIYAMNADGSNQRRITRNEVDDWEPKWSPDGRWVMYYSQRNSGWEIFITTSDGREELQLTSGNLTGSQATWHP